MTHEGTVPQDTSTFAKRKVAFQCLSSTHLFHRINFRSLSLAVGNECEIAKVGCECIGKKNMASKQRPAPRSTRSAGKLLAEGLPPSTPVAKPAATHATVATTVAKTKTPAKGQAKKSTQRAAPAQAFDGDSVNQELVDVEQEEDSEAGLQRARLADSVAMAVEALLSAKWASAKKRSPFATLHRRLTWCHHHGPASSTSSSLTFGWRPERGMRFAGCRSMSRFLSIRRAHSVPMMYPLFDVRWA